MNVILSKDIPSLNVEPFQTKYNNIIQYFYIDFIVICTGKIRKHLQGDKKRQWEEIKSFYLSYIYNDSKTQLINNHKSQGYKRETYRFERLLKHIGN